MRLIVTDTGQFVEISDPAKYIYAILSHTWDPEGEQSYRAVREIQLSAKMRILPESALDDKFFAGAPLESPFEPRDGIPPVLSSIDSVLYDAQVSVTSPTISTPYSSTNTTFACDSPAHTHITSNVSTAAQPTLTPLVPARAAIIEGTSQGPSRPSILDHPSLSPKLKNACAVAHTYGYRLLWIDSCCIEKESSAELSEAINSMFRWYGCASVCFAFLPDFPTKKLAHYQLCYDIDIGETLRAECRWFTRGWTLQELIAPREVVFLDKDWRFFGNKSGLAEILAQATFIEVEILTHRRSLHEVSVASRMSWAHHRETTRVEDRAYSLFGIFGVNLPIIYGEEYHAFLRLQKEILQTIPDQSLFIWNHGGPSGYGLLVGIILESDWWTRDKIWVTTRDCPSRLLADSSRRFDPWPHRFGVVSPQELTHRLGRPDLPHPSYTITPYGVHASLPLIRITDVLLNASVCGETQAEIYLAVLACESIECPESLVAMVCTLAQDDAQAAGRTVRKSLHKLFLDGGWNRNTLSCDYPSPFVILPQDLLERFRDTARPVREEQVSMPLTSPSQLEPCSRSTAWVHRHMNLSPNYWIPQLHNRRILEDSGYVIRMTSQLIPEASTVKDPVHLWERKETEFVVLIQLTRDTFSVQVRLTILVMQHESVKGSGRFDNISSRIRMDVGRDLSLSPPPASSTDVYTAHDFQRIRDVPVFFHGASGPEVILRIQLTYHIQLRTWLLDLDVLGYKAARDALGKIHGLNGWELDRLSSVLSPT